MANHTLVSLRQTARKSLHIQLTIGVLALLMSLIPVFGQTSSVHANSTVTIKVTILNNNVDSVKVFNTYTQESECMVAGQRNRFTTPLSVNAFTAFFYQDAHCLDSPQSSQQFPISPGQTSYDLTIK